MNLLLQGEDNVTLETAEKIAKLSGGTEEYWLSLQKAYDEKKALLKI
ncbi:hypothetical protein SAMN02745213_00306 [Succinivibrio dextrinosolvens DSM 3072]|uniref:Addiction module antidote protein, HigA family n=1 Tax=Succinivibrio dextrinosolvens DSM 3072 TaxID=1123324 RepID=A0A1T4UZ41_9GAMM|nr:hypothetical protein [Succinivibrio dextrinosolvens]SKA57970.1 hypothetical protein SAMN02745213_00306 [Succinivibrio dextrinosolvens DSM 3072]